jgi:hypothetical protein
MILVVNESEEQEVSLKKSKFQQILGSGWPFSVSFDCLPTNKVQKLKK